MVDRTFLGVEPISVFCVERTNTVEDACKVDIDGDVVADTVEEVMLTSTGVSPVAGWVEGALDVFTLLEVHTSVEVESRPD